MDSHVRWIAATDGDELSAVLPALDDRAWVEAEDSADPGADSGLEDLLAGLESDPEEAWRAFQGLEAIDSEGRLQIVDELVKAPPREGLTRLLHLLGASRDPRTRAAVRRALGTERTSDFVEGEERGLALIEVRPRLHLIRSSVAAVDGEGVGAIVVSTARDGRSTTAAFLCDVRTGIRDALGVVDDGSGIDGECFDPFPELAAGPTVEDAPDLALGLLAGSLMISGRTAPPKVRDWLDQTLGANFHSGAFLAAKAEWTASPVGSAVLAERSWSVLEACPSWVDRSPLTFELAEEITLRDGRAAADPARDAGAYRFLFERRLIHRLELYQRMLLWMAFFWEAAGEPDLSLSAGVLAGQLADEQYAVPAHPFAVALTTRSLHEAQRLLGTAADPRRD